jgi:chemotaxis protein CheX
MELIQPFIDAADSVFSESLQSPAKIGDLSMDENAYRRKGVAALIAIKGDIEGRVILDLSPEVAVKIASQLAGVEVKSSDQVVRETVCELANMVIGNSVTLLNDQGFRFKVFPPEIICIAAPATETPRQRSASIPRSLPANTQPPKSMGGLMYAAPCRNNPAETIGCENTIRIGTKIALLPGVNGTATSARVPSGYSFRLRNAIPPFERSSQTATSS